MTGSYPETCFYRRTDTAVQDMQSDREPAPR